MVGGEDGKGGRGGEKTERVVAESEEGERIGGRKEKKEMAGRRQSSIQALNTSSKTGKEGGSPRGSGADGRAGGGCEGEEE